MKLKKVFSCLCSVLLLSALSLQAFAKTNEQALTLSPVSLEEYPLYQKEDRSASAYIVMEGTTGRVLYGKNIHERLAMASTTKIIGALMVLEQENLDEYFMVDSDAIQVEGSSMGLTEGDLVSLYSLACGMMLPSGNDAANAAGVRLYGSIDGFVEAMNQKAEELGLSDTHYVTACGLDAADHYSTAFDLAKLTRIALQNEDFAYICSQSNMKVKFGDPPYERWLKNYNRLLELYPDCIGVKTGFTDDAGRCLVSAAERGGMTLICVTLNAQDDWNLHASLYDKCFESYSMTPLPDIPSSITLAGDKLQENGIESELMLKPAYEASVPLKAGESARLTATVLCEPFAYAPAQLGRVYAQTLFSLDGYPLCSVPMVASS